jgi:D-alanyl-D-alanine carboxypeptidase/D-alanyl-D-alanine-endopeptidase (penicillin-binding protein 4)
MVKGFGKIVLMALVGLIFAPAAIASLSSRIIAIVNDKSQKTAHFTIDIVDAASGRTLYARDSEEPMAPASNMKIVTSAAALHYLGADYRFVTRVGLIGKTLVVIGGGDPLLGDPQTDQKYGRAAGWIFADIVSALHENKQKSLQEIIIDRYFLDDNRVCANWPVDQLNQSYACEVSGLNYNCNSVKVSARKSGSRAVVTVDPDTRYIHIVNEVAVASRGNNVIAAYRNAEPNKLKVVGKVGDENGASADVAIEAPATFFGVLLAEHLAQSGIKIPNQIVRKYARNDKHIKIIREYATPLSDVLARCNKDSLNLAAEVFVKTISAEHTDGRINGEWPHGQVLVGRYLQSLGITPGEFVLDDGSGLSRENRLTANAITRVLLEVYGGDNWLLFRDSLAVGGVDGTIARYFREDKYRGRIIGKTGYLDGVRAFSGICTTAQGDVIFSILTSGGSAATRSAINDIAEAIIDELG